MGRPLLQAQPAAAIRSLHGGSVRPTRRVLSDLGLGFPSLDRALEDIDEPLLRKAQDLPDELAAGGAERVLSLADRVWFKVKTVDERGAAGEVATPDLAQELHQLPPAGWWLVAAGHRQQDTPRRDFYARLESECVREGKGSGKPSTDGLLPTEIDYKRWGVERTTLAVSAMKDLVRQAVARSAHDGKLWTVTVQRHVIGALVRSTARVTSLSPPRATGTTRSSRFCLMRYRGSLGTIGGPNQGLSWASPRPRGRSSSPRCFLLRSCARSWMRQTATSSRTHPTPPNAGHTTSLH